MVSEYFIVNLDEEFIIHEWMTIILRRFYELNIYSFKFTPLTRKLKKKKIVWSDFLLIIYILEGAKGWKTI